MYKSDYFFFVCAKKFTVTANTFIDFLATFFCFAFISLTAKRKKQIWRIETVVFGVPFDGAFVDGVVDGIDVCVGGCGGGGCGDGGNSNIGLLYIFVHIC